MLEHRETDECVVLLEDDENHVALFEAALAEARPGTRLECARNTAELLESCRSLTAGSRLLVFLDLKLSGESGVDVVKAMRRERELETVPTIILSSSEWDRDVARCLRSGANSYITKPMSFDAFVRTIESATGYWFTHHRHPRAELDAV